MCEVNFRWFINITESGALKYYSGSVCELGENAGQNSWKECCEAVRNIESNEVAKFLTDIAEHFDELKNHFADYGAWDSEDITSWTLFDLAALCLQEFVNEYRQFCDYCGSSWKRYREESESGSISGRLYRGESGERFLYFGM